MKSQFAYSLLCASLLLMGCNSSSDTAPSGTSADSTATPAATQADSSTDDTTTEDPAGEPAESDAAANTDTADDADSGSPSLEEFAQRFRDAAQAGNLDEAMTSVNEAIAAYPDNVPMQVNRLMLKLHLGQQLEAQDADGAAQHYIDAGEYIKTLQSQADQIPAQVQGIIPVALLNEARGYAQQSKVTEAIASLNAAIDAGISGLNDVEQDPMLSKIADNEEFKAALESIQSKLHEKMLEECREEIANTQAFPFDFTLPDLDGNDVKLADLKGKFVIVDVWGTWCPPCKKEIPHFIQLLNENKDELVMVGINYEGVDAEEAVAKIRTFVDENGINYPCVIGDEETQQQIPDFQGYPTTLFIDPTGAVRLKIVGYHPYEKLATYLSLLQGKDPAAL